MHHRANNEIRLLSAGDVPAAFQLSSIAGWNQTAEDWLRLLNLSPDRCFCIQAGDTVAATATLQCYQNRLAWIGMVLTHPDYRRQGLATRLLKHALAHADRLGILTVKLDATEHGQPLYESLGFTPEQPVERWFRAPRESNKSSSQTAVSTQSIRTEIDISLWRDTDLNAFGVDRSRLLQSLIEEGKCLANHAACLLIRAGKNTTYLGPSVANDLSSARELFQRALEWPAEGGWSWDLLPQNRNAVALAAELGFTPQRHLVRMFRGKELRGNDNLIYALAGFELG